MLASVFPSLAAPKWIDPSPGELKMVSDPQAPGAPAEYLNYELWTGRGPRTVYARIKIFTEKGREEYSDIRIPYFRFSSGNASATVEARTIQPDGTVVPFTGQMFDREVVSFRGYSLMQKVFSMPDVRVGSILEFRYTIAPGYMQSGWSIQQPIFVRKGVFHYQGWSDLPMHTTEVLPAGVKVKGTPMGGYDLEIENVPALPEEDDSPPMQSVGYRVQFLYTPYQNAEEFWKKEGQDWSWKVNDVATPSGKVKSAVDQLIAPTDSELEKLQKIYSAVMKLENTDFTRQRTREEDKAEKIKIRTANDIWTAQRGDGDDLALLFVTMARAAGLKAYAMYVADRSRTIFLKDVPDWQQLNDLIAVVQMDGKEMYFDPGERYCEFGKLKWTHTWTGGIRQTGLNGAELATTSTPAFSDNQVIRSATLQMDADGNVHGTVKVTMTGNEALRWRQEALRTDEQSAREKFSTELQQDLPPGVHVTTTQMLSLADYTEPLVVILDASGTITSHAGHLLLAPGTFFETRGTVQFATVARETPVYLQYPYEVEDQVKLTLPATATVQSVPQDAQIPFVPNADFVAKYRTSESTYMYARRLRVANILYETKDYPALRAFFQKVSAQDQQQIVLRLTQQTARAPVAGDW